MEKIGNIQLGKGGVTKNFVETLRGHFNRQKVVKISVLPSARESKADVLKYAEEIQKAIGSNFSYRVIGFTIAFKRLRRGLKAKQVRE